MNKPLLTKSFYAGAAISKHRIVKFGADDDHVIQGAAATDSLIGVSVELDAAADERVDIVLAGAATVEYGAAVTRGDRLTTDANGQAIPANRHTHTENTEGAYTQNATTGPASGEQIIGVALVDGAAGDLGSMLINPAFA